MKRLYFISALLVIVFSGCGSDSTSTPTKDSNLIGNENNSSSITAKVTYPDYVNYNCTPKKESTSTVFCIKSDDTYMSIGRDPSETEITLLKKILHDFPRRMRERVVEIRLKSEDIGEGSASVSPLDGDKIHWEMWVNTSDGVSDKEDPLEATIAHELKHYLTLNSTQEGKDDSRCGDMMATLDACPASDTVYFDFIQEFWKPMYDKEIWTSEDAYNYYYENHPDDFVTPYAVTNSGEDIAETFSFFIFGKEPTDLSKIKDKKIKYFWKFPELVTLRSEIRSNLKMTD